MILGPCTRCGLELSARPHWTNLKLHHDCLVAAEREVEARVRLEEEARAQAEALRAFNQRIIDQRLGRGQ